MPEEAPSRSGGRDGSKAERDPEASFRTDSRRRTSPCFRALRRWDGEETRVYDTHEWTSISRAVLWYARWRVRYPGKGARRCQNSSSTSSLLSMGMRPPSVGQGGGGSGAEYLAWLGKQPEADYAILMGVTTYVSCRDSPPEVSLDQCAGRHVEGRLLDHIEQASLMGGVGLAAQDPVEAVHEMKEKGSRSMRTVGSLTSVALS